MCEHTDLIILHICWNLTHLKGWKRMFLLTRNLLWALFWAVRHLQVYFMQGEHFLKLYYIKSATQFVISEESSGALISLSEKPMKNVWDKRNFFFFFPQPLCEQVFNSTFQFHTCLFLVPILIPTRHWYSLSKANSWRKHFVSAEKCLTYQMPFIFKRRHQTQ